MKTDDVARYVRRSTPPILHCLIHLIAAIIATILLTTFTRASGGREGGQARWHCYEVRVSESGGGCKYTFPCNKWIRVSEDQDVNDAVILSVDSEKTEESKITTTRSECDNKLPINQ